MVLLSPHHSQIARSSCLSHGLVMAGPRTDAMGLMNGCVT